MFGQAIKTQVKDRIIMEMKKHLGAEMLQVLDSVLTHKYRKTLGMNLKNQGVDIGTMQEVMGHATPAVTAMYYAQSTPNTLRREREVHVA